MAAAAQKEHEDNGDITGEYQRPDAVVACEIYDQQIKPKLVHIATIKGDLSEPWDHLKEQSRIPRVVFNFVQKLVDEDDDQKREHMLVSLHEMMKARGLTVPEDLVSIADGTAGASPIPTGERKRPALATINGGRSNGDGFTEATEDELAGQEGRRAASPADDAADDAAPQEGSEG